MPSLKADPGVNVQVPAPLTVAVPSSNPPSKTETVEPTAPVPVIAGGLIRVSDGVKTTGAAGAAVSIVTLIAAALLSFPATSVAIIENAYVASDSAPVTMLHEPVASAVVVRPTPLQLTLTVDPASAVPLTVMSESFVIKSDALVPVSILIPSDAGITGAVASMVSCSGALGLPSLPAVSVAVTVNERCPAANAVPAVIVHVPSETVAVPRAKPPEYSVITCPLVPVPVIVGVVSLVMRSPSAPESEALANNGVGAAGRTVTRVTESVADDVPMLPARSSRRAVSAVTPSLNELDRDTIVEPAVTSAAETVALPSTVTPSRILT